MNQKTNKIEAGDLVEIIKNLNPEFPECNYLIGKFGEVAFVHPTLGYCYLKEYPNLTFFMEELRKIDPDISELTDILELENVVKRYQTCN